MKGSFSFIVRDKNLDFEYISENLTIIPTSIIKKGQFIRKGGSTQAPYDVWQFEIIISQQTEPEDALEHLLKKLTPHFGIINELIETYKEVIINCYLRSEYGQMGLRLSNKMMKKIALLGIGLDIHILSFGGVEN
jgi:hypothetical protein